MATLLLLAMMAAAPGERSFPVKDFDSVALDAAADVTIASGPAFSMRASGDPALVARLTATVDGGKLVIRFARGETHSSHDGVRIALTMPRLTGVSIGGAGNIVADRAIARTFDAHVGGAGHVTVKSLTAAETRLTTGGAGSLTVAGTTGSLYARVSGVGSVEAGKLAAKAADLGVTGTGSIEAHVDGPVKALLTGIGSIDVKGAAQCETHRTGIGSITCGGKA